MEEKETTSLSKYQSELDAWSKLVRDRPFYTFFLVLGIVFLIGLGSIAPRAAGDLYSIVVRPAPQNPFSNTQITYSNIVPQASDIIELDHAGTLTPSPYNVPHYTLSPEGACSTNGNSLAYSQGIVLILNVSPTFSSHDVEDASKPARGITFNPNTIPASHYFSFELGTTHKISTDGRTFKVTLSRINDLTTKKNGTYFSYVFDINEQ